MRPQEVPPLLRELADLRDSGALSEDEYAAKKTELLAFLTPNASGATSTADGPTAPPLSTAAPEPRTLPHGNHGAELARRHQESNARRGRVPLSGSGNVLSKKRLAALLAALVTCAVAIAGIVLVSRDDGRGREGGPLGDSGGTELPLRISGYIEVDRGWEYRDFIADSLGEDFIAGEYEQRNDAATPTRCIDFSDDADELGKGTRVTIRGDDGEVLTTTEISGDGFLVLEDDDDFNGCSYLFDASDFPESDVYVIEIDDLGEFTYTREELQFKDDELAPGVPAVFRWAQVTIRSRV